MNRRATILLHVAAWLVLFVSPLTFLRGDGLSLGHYLMLCVSPVLMMTVFYANYFWLTPHYFVRGKHRYYLLINIVMVVTLGVSIHYWMVYVHSIYDPVRYISHKRMVFEDIFFNLRDIFSLTVSAVIATTIVLSLRWQHSEDARLEAEAARAEAELKNLRSQINPHFLLNTLNNIYALTAFDTARAQEAIQQLSKMLRHMLYDNQQESVALKDELQFLSNYVSLMKIRLPKSVDVTFNQKVSNPEVRIAPLIFISLIENAFKHGISPTDPSFIHISIATGIERQGDHDVRDTVTCTIDNSNHPKTQRDRSGHGIGLKQVQRRLDLTYPHRYEWTKGPSPDGSTYHSQIILRL